MSFAFAPSKFAIVRGTTWQDSLQLVDDAGAAINLTGIDDIVMRVRSTIGSNTVLMELSVTNGRLVVVTAASGLVNILVAAEDTLDFPIAGNRKKKYVYDALIIRPGTPDTIEPGYKGKLTVNPQVTRYLAEPA